MRRILLGVPRATDVVYACLLLVVLVACQKRAASEPALPSLNVSYGPDSMMVAISQHELAPLIEENIYFRVPLNLTQSATVIQAAVELPPAVRELHVYRHRGDKISTVAGPFRVFRQLDGASGIHYAHLGDLVKPGTELIASFGQAAGLVVWPAGTGSPLDPSDALLVVLTSVNPAAIAGEKGAIHLTLRFGTLEQYPDSLRTFWHSASPFEISPSSGDVPALTTAGGIWVVPDDGKLLGVSAYAHEMMTGFELHRLTDNDQMSLVVHSDKRFLEPKWLDPPIVLRAGDSLIYRCTYANATRKKVANGHGWTEEQCALGGWWLPRGDGKKGE